MPCALVWLTAAEAPSAAVVKSRGFPRVQQRLSVSDTHAVPARHAGARPAAMGRRCEIEHQRRLTHRSRLVDPTSRYWLRRMSLIDPSMPEPDRSLI